jgi:hypothetical protein
MYNDAYEYITDDMAPDKTAVQNVFNARITVMLFQREI